jgi:hypothetical protein
MVRWFILPVLAFTLMAAKCESPHAACIPLKNYSALFQKNLAAEVESVMVSKPHIAAVIKDYGITRDQIRACVKK